MYEYEKTYQQIVGVLWGVQFCIVALMGSKAWFFGASSEDIEFLALASFLLTFFGPMIAGVVVSASLFWLGAAIILMWTVIGAWLIAGAKVWYTPGGDSTGALAFIVGIIICLVAAVYAERLVCRYILRR